MRVHIEFDGPYDIEDAGSGTQPEDFGNNGKDSFGCTIALIKMLIYIAFFPIPLSAWLVKKPLGVAVKGVLISSLWIFYIVLLHGIYLGNKTGNDGIIDSVVETVADETVALGEELLYAETIEPTVKSEESKPETEGYMEENTLSDKERSRLKEKEIYQQVKTEPVEYNTLQQLFLDLPETFSIEELEEFLNSREEIYYKISRINVGQDPYIEGIIADNDDPYNLWSSYTGKGNSDLSRASHENIEVIFDEETHLLEYYMYVNSSHNAIVVYHSGYLGDRETVRLWNEYTVEDDSGYYGRQLYAEDGDSNYRVTFRSDEDVPYLYRGDLDKDTKMLKFASKEEVVNRLVWTNITSERYWSYIRESEAAAGIL